MIRLVRCGVALALATVLLGAAPPPVESLGTAPDGFDLRLAQANVARAGAASLPAMEKMAGEHDPRLDVRLRQTVGLMLIVSTPWEDVQKCPGLVALCKDDFDKARDVAKIFVGAESYDSGARGWSGPNTPPPTPSPAQVALGKLRDSYG